MTTLMPVDANDLPLPVLRLRSGGSHVIEADDISARNTLAFNVDTRVISLYATVPVFVRFGAASVVATDTDHYIPADTLIDLYIAGDDRQSFTHVAALCVAGTGTVYVSEKY